MDITDKILKLKKERGAVILAHNYQVPEVQDIADFVGDSLGLSIEASKTPAKVIVFCGVYFMAETAKILSPEKTVLIPDRHAGCPMADMINAAQLIELKKLHPKAKVLCYVNTTAEVKAECDLCCTSANAVDLVKGAFSDDEEIIFVPDRYLAEHVAGQTGRTFIAWHGYCPTHALILPEDISRAKDLHPNAVVLAHPECTSGVRALADKVISTEAMYRFAKTSVVKEFIVATEIGMLHRLKKDNTDKEFYPATAKAVCPNMKRISLEHILWSLEGMTHEITLESAVILKAAKSIERMLEYKA